MARSNNTQAVYVRLPAAEAEKLDQAAYALRLSKRDLITSLVARHVDPASPSSLRALGRGVASHAESTSDRRRIVVETGSDPLAVGHHSFRPAEAPEVLTPAEVAELLVVDEDAVLVLAEAGDLPGRQVGGEWRFARRAVLDWLAAGQEGAAD